MVWFQFLQLVRAACLAADMFCYHVLMRGLAGPISRLAVLAQRGRVDVAFNVIAQPGPIAPKAGALTAARAHVCFAQCSIHMFYDARQPCIQSEYEGGCGSHRL